jgi:hypothetical protein
MVNAVLQNVAYGLRSTYHSSITATPGQIVFGRDMVIYSIFLANWKNIAEKHLTQIRNLNTAKNKSHFHHYYSIGDLVYIFKSHNDPKFASLQGSFQILQVHSNGTVKICCSEIVRELMNIQ